MVKILLMLSNFNFRKKANRQLKYSFISWLILAVQFFITEFIESSGVQVNEPAIYINLIIFVMFIAFGFSTCLASFMFSLLSFAQSKKAFIEFGFSAILIFAYILPFTMINYMA